MNNRFAQLLAPMGCYSTVDGVTSIQRETQGYIRTSTQPSERSLAALKKRIAAATKVTTDVKAAAEVHVISHPRAPEVFALRAFSQRIAAVMLINAIMKEMNHG